MVFPKDYSKSQTLSDQETKEAEKTAQMNDDLGQPEDEPAIIKVLSDDELVELILEENDSDEIAPADDFLEDDESDS